MLNILIKIWGRGDDQSGGILLVDFLFARCVDIMGADLSKGCVRPRLWIVGKYMYMDPICNIDIVYAMYIGTFMWGA